MVKKKGRDLHGIILLDKPQGGSSNGVMQQVKRYFQANKVGHTGALDPLATGMLPICFGEATKFSQHLLDADKCYLVTAKLGERTDTSDAEGEVIAVKSVNVNLAQIKEALPHFTGDLQQVPTMFSALKHQGKPLYEYARAGITVEREARPITIFSLEFIEYQAPYLTLSVHCSKGTYIRTLIDDLGEYLGCGAHVTMLRRTKVANYPYSAMVTMEQLGQLAQQQDFAALDALLLPMDTAIADLPQIMLSLEQAQKLIFGQRIKLEPSPVAALYRIYDENSRFLGVAEVINSVLHPRRLVNQTVLDTK
ncbi:tRNA pseudouridine(55) synthase TruB [Gallibacterium anatis]|uniref:tRNA pseudouridine synthase B n=1 Tax=Gallibacterium anatis TaxID=750 RepID=A0AAX3X8Z2_9PAST|nr:tRNA pseudouridine(55) synthase TruB [Gallibacterium anatis]MDK9431427.1 tRNA pseudouridine(55) synthase TruB [Gallibacterium anatis]WIM78489.1 tRNA pseudouridine(55) synthase TruB [Gallibacterium anatis]